MIPDDKPVDLRVPYFQTNPNDPNETSKMVFQNLSQVELLQYFSCVYSTPVTVNVTTSCLFEMMHFNAQLKPITIATRPCLIRGRAKYSKTVPWRSGGMKS